MVRGEGGAGAGTAANGGTEGAQAAANAHAPLSETERIARELHAVSRLFGGPPRPRSSGRLVSDGIFARPDAATWKERKLALQRLTRLFESDMALVGEALLTEASLLRAMALQLADLRSEVVREGATCVCTFARAVAAGSSVSAAKLVAVALSALAMPLLRLVGSANRVMAAHGARAAVATFSALRSPKLLALFATTASADKNPAIRCGVARYVALCIEEWPRGIVGKGLESVEVALAAGAADASSECRTLTCGGLVAYYRRFTRRADALLRKLPEKTQRAVWEQLGAAIHGNGTPFSANDTEAYGSLRKAPDPAALERIAKRFEADRAKAAERGKAKREKTHDNGLANGLNTSVYGSRGKATDPTALEMIPKRSEDEHTMAAEPGKRDKAPDNRIANGSSAPVDGSLGTASPSASDHVVRSFRRSSSGSSASSNADPAALERRARRSEADLAKAIERGKARRDKVRDKGLPGGFNNSTAISPRDTKPAVPSEQKGNNAAPQVGKQGATSSSSPYAPIAGRVKGKAKAPTHVPKKSQQLPETQSPLMRTPDTPDGPGSPMRRGNAEMSPNGGVKSAPEGKAPRNQGASLSSDFHVVVAAYVRNSLRDKYAEGLLWRPWERYRDHCYRQGNVVRARVIARAAIRARVDAAERGRIVRPALAEGALPGAQCARFFHLDVIIHLGVIVRRHIRDWLRRRGPEPWGRVGRCKHGRWTLPPRQQRHSGAHAPHADEPVDSAGGHIAKRSLRALA